MASGVSSPGERSPGWDIELTLSDWWQAIVNGDGDRMDEIKNPRRRELVDRFDNIGWGLLFLLFAVVALPSGVVQYASAAAVGGAMLVLNAARVVAAVPIRWFSIILGGAFLIGGGAALGGIHMDVFLLFFVLAGVVTIAGAIFKPRRAIAH
jgi:hypothetical protein